MGLRRIFKARRGGLVTRGDNVRQKGFTLTAVIDLIFLIGTKTLERVSFVYIECAQGVSCLISSLIGFLVV